MAIRTASFLSAGLTDQQWEVQQLEVVAAEGPTCAVREDALLRGHAAGGVQLRKLHAAARHAPLNVAALPGASLSPV